MPEIIRTYKGSYSRVWSCRVRKKNPQTDRWEDDDLSDVTAITATMEDAETGKVKFQDQTASVDVANALVKYQPVATNVDTAGWYVIRWTATRAGKPHILPSEEDNKVYVRIWEN